MASSTEMYSGQYFNLETKGHCRYESVKSSSRHLRNARPVADANSAATAPTPASVVAPSVDDEGFTSATDAPLRRFPKLKTTSNILSHRGVIIPGLPLRGSELAPALEARGLVAEDSVGSFLSAKRQCQLALDEIVVRVHEHRDRHAGTDAQFVDPTFFVGTPDVLFPHGSPPDSTVGVPRDVSRLSSMYPGVPVVSARQPKSPKVTSALVSPTKGGGVRFAEAPPSLARVTRGHGDEDEISDDDAVNFSESEGRVFDEFVCGALGDAHLVAAFNALVTTSASPSWRKKALHRLIVLPRRLDQARAALHTVDAALNGLQRSSDAASDEASRRQSLRFELAGSVGDSVDFDASSFDGPLDMGAVGVLLFVDGLWTWVIVDDTIPVGHDGRSPLFLRIVPKASSATATISPTHAAGSQLLSASTVSKSFGRSDGSEMIRPPTELWPLLIEKAFAKLHGCYDGIDGGRCEEALGLLTGGHEFVFRLSSDLSNESAEATAKVNQAGSRRWHPNENRRRAQQPFAHGSRDSRRSQESSEFETRPPSCAEFDPQLPSVIPAVLGRDDEPALNLHVHGIEERRPRASFDAFGEVVTDHEGMCFVAVARTKPRADRTASARIEKLRDDEKDAARLVKFGGWAYPIVRTWRSEEDKEGRVELYDGWSDASAILDYNVRVASQRREQRVLKLLDEAQRGMRNEAAVKRFATSALAVKRGSAARFILLRWSTFVDLFDVVDGVHVLPDLFPVADTVATSYLSPYHTVIGSGAAPATLRSDTGVLVQNPMPCFVFRVDAPVPGNYHLRLTQRDPKTFYGRGSVSHFHRKNAPLSTIAFTLYGFGEENPNDLIKALVSSRTAAGIHAATFALRAHRKSTKIAATPAVYARQVSASCELDAGFYLVVPIVAKGPETGFAVSVTAPCAAVLRIARLAVPGIEKSVADDISAHQQRSSEPVVHDVARLLAGDASVAEATLETIKKLRGCVAGQPAADEPANDEEPLSYQRARAVRAAGGYVSDPKTTMEPDGSVSTRRLARPTDLMLQIKNHDGDKVAAAAAGNDASLLNRKMVKLMKEQAREQETIMQPPMVDMVSSRPPPFDAASAFLCPPPAGCPDPQTHVEHVCMEAMQHADVLRRGTLTTERHIEAALGHLLLHGTRLGVALKTACMRQFPAADEMQGGPAVEGVTHEGLVRALLSVFSEADFASSAASSAAHRLSVDDISRRRSSDMQ